MAEYETRAATIGDITLTASKASKDNAGERLTAVLKWLGTSIDNSLPGSGARPDQGLPGDQPGVDNTLPGGKPGRPSNELPGDQPGVDNTLPGGKPTRPEQGLPGDQPGVGNELPLEDLAKLLKEKAKEIAAEILKGTACDPAKPK